MTKRDRRKRRWFELGKEAAERATRRPAPGYACPICARWFTSPAEVTFEHAPPKKIGGRAIALTCRECNSTAGHTVDAEFAKAQDVREWGRGRSAKPLRGRLTFEGSPVTVDVERTPELVTIVGRPEHSHPKHAAAQSAAFERIASSGEPYTEPLHFVRLPIRASADARGRARADPQPEAELIERFILHRSEPLERRLLAWIESPTALESFVAHIDDHLVFLPGPKGESTIYERFAARKRWPLRVEACRHVEERYYDWPTRPEHLIDLAWDAQPSSGEDSPGP